MAHGDAINCASAGAGFWKFGRLATPFSGRIIKFCPISPHGNAVGDIAGVAQLVEHHVANVIVDGSSPFTRFFCLHRTH